MGKEIERKFLVQGRAFEKEATKTTTLKKGYLSLDPEKTVRIRTQDNTAFITIKGKTTGYTRAEYEYEIPYADAVEMLENLCLTIIEKVRFYVDYDGFMWEVDVFEGDNEGLVVAEIELPGENTSFSKPPWVAEEVTGNQAYYNASLVQHPYHQWH